MTGPDGRPRRIAILGAGREGRAALQWLRRTEPGAERTVITEQAPRDDFESGLEPEESLRVEPLSAERLTAFDLVVRSPGISPYRPELRAAREQGVKFTSGTNLWFASHPRARTICVTGTKGKSTTAALLAQMLGKAGWRAQLAGNIGRPLLACEDVSADWWVVELSSYQIADLEARPDIVVLLNLSPEHLDWHGGAENYVADKLRLAALVRPGGLIVNAADPALRRRFAGRDDIVWFGARPGIHSAGKDLLDNDRSLRIEMPSSLPGAHNRANVAAALTAARLAGADVDDAARAVAEFTGLPHRLQVLGERSGVRFVNDSIASTPFATAAALEALSESPVIVLVGGFDRGIDWGESVAAFRRHPPRALFTMPDNGKKILAALRDGGLDCPGGLHATGGLTEAAGRARALARPGDVVLLSPGAPSFPHFTDYRERGQAFCRAVGLPPVDE